MVSQEISAAVGRLILGKVNGLTLDDEFAYFLKSGITCGVTLFKDNARDLPQLIKLVDGVHAAGGEDTLVTVDQEGGAVQRFDHVMSPLPSAMALASLESPEMVKNVFEISGEQLRLLGVNLVYAPVLDLATNPLNPIISTRAFSDKPEKVIELAHIVADTYLKFGILTVGKHFPGHGDTFEDSHAGLAMLKAALDQLEKRELLPFKEGLKFLPSAMVAHIWLSSLESKPLPGSLSAKVVTDLLRKRLGFDGVIMTDDMPGMRAITDYWGLEEAAVNAIKAGIDLLLICGSNEQVRSVHAALVKAVDQGTISQERLKQSVDRLRKFTSLFAGRYDASKKDAPVRLERLRQSIEFGSMFLDQYSAHAICAVKGKAPNLISDDSWVIVSPNHPRYALDLKTHMSEYANLYFHQYPLNPTAADIDEAVRLVRGKNCLLLTFRGLIFNEQVNLARQLAAAAQTKVVVACDSPFELVEMSSWDTQLALLDPSEHAIKALSLVLTGEEKVGGTLPVTLHGVAV